MRERQREGETVKEDGVYFAQGYGPVGGRDGAGWVQFKDGQRERETERKRKRRKREGGRQREKMVQGWVRLVAGLAEPDTL